MTLSIVARCPDTGQVGVAAATGTPGVGKLLTWARARVGAVATQGWVNPYLGIDALDLLANGHPAARVLEAVLALDPAPEQRQVGLVDAWGHTATWTGPACADWAGARQGDGWCVQGNLLESGRGVAECAAAFATHDRGRPLVERLMAALESGVRAGGDRRGERSATVYVMDVEEYPLWDVRVDDSRDPITDLWRTQDVLATELVAQIRKLPRREDPRGDLDPTRRDGNL